MEIDVAKELSSEATINLPYGRKESNILNMKICQSSALVAKLWGIHLRDAIKDNNLRANLMRSNLPLLLNRLG